MLDPEVMHMDIRIDIIEAVKDALQDRVDDQILAIVQDTLIIELNRYEVQERYTEVAVPDRSAEGQLKKYLATNTHEACAAGLLLTKNRIE